MSVGMMETTNQLLDINTVISYKVPVQCCERFVRIVYRAGIEILRNTENILRLYPTNVRTLVSYDDDGSSSSSNSSSSSSSSSISC